MGQLGCRCVLLDAMDTRLTDPFGRFRRAFMALSPTARAILCLRLVEREDVDSIAAALGISPSVVEAENEEARDSISAGLGLPEPNVDDRIRHLIDRLPVPAPSPDFTERLLRLRRYRTPPTS